LYAFAKKFDEVRGGGAGAEAHNHAFLDEFEGFLRGEFFGVVVDVHGKESLDVPGIGRDIYFRNWPGSGVCVR
jgi:hypothetical protein